MKDNDVLPSILFIEAEYFDYPIVVSDTEKICLHHVNNRPLSIINNLIPNKRQNNNLVLGNKKIDSQFCGIKHSCKNGYLLNILFAPKYT